MTPTTFSTMGSSITLQYVDALLLNPNPEKFASVFSDGEFEAILDRKGEKRVFNR